MVCKKLSFSLHESCLAWSLTNTVGVGAFAVLSATVVQLTYRQRAAALINYVKQTNKDISVQKKQIRIAFFV
jgi:hypothetical protein